MFKHFFLIFGFLLLLCWEEIGNATVLYTPAPFIWLTWSNSDVRFDVAWVIFDAGTTAGKPELDTSTKNLVGSFYMSGIGWWMLQTGSYQVAINCASMPLSDLTANCHLTGSGWAESIWELGFSWVEYVPSLWVLSGTIRSFVWDLSLSGIFLPLKPSYLEQNLDKIPTNHEMLLFISWAFSYNEGLWELTISPHKAVSPRILISSNTGTFSLTDFSLADTYTLTLEDPDGSTTVWDTQILPGAFSLTLAPSGYFLEVFCTNHPLDCPDGATLSPTELVKTGNNLVWDGESYYHFRLKSRDQYGNLINTGTVNISYVTTIKTVQFEEDGSTLGPSIFLPSLPGWAVILSWGVLTNFLDGTSAGNAIALLGQDILYSIGSSAPSDTENEVKLLDITYTSPLGISTPLSWVDTSPLIFRPWFVATTSTLINDIQIGEKHEFHVDIVNNSPLISNVPYIFSFLSVGDNAFWAFRDFTSSDISISCQAYAQELSLYSWLCDWSILGWFVTPSVFEVETKTSFDFTGSYAPMSRYPIKEDVTWENVISYLALDTLGIPTSIAYKWTKSLFGESVFRNSWIKILGENNGLGEYGDISLDGNGKVKYLDQVRKNISLLSRNRTSYADVDYEVITGDTILTANSFNSKRTIIVLGGKVTVSENIPDKPLPMAIISLSDTLGNGGTIEIDPSVTDIWATLITDRHVSTSGDKQLYIHGSIISSNTLGDTLAQICPYYVSVVCDVTEAAKYDIEKLREWFIYLANTTGKTAVSEAAKAYPHTAIIIEHDANVIINPPPGL